MTKPEVLVASAGTASDLVESRAGSDAFLTDVLAGLRRRPRRLPCKYFYDKRGSRLFEEICELPEYYLTRTELSILLRHAGEISERLGPGCQLVELGSGSSLKTRILLDHLTDPRGYVPVDISRQHLLEAAADLTAAYPWLAVAPVCTDYSAEAEIPLPDTPSGVTAVFFPGSSIGNFHPPQATRLLARISRLCGPGGRLLLGVDLKKDPKSIERAYNDAGGVTAAFNRNLLLRINRELEGDFDTENWHHHAFYEPVAGRIEMHLVSKSRQHATIAGQEFQFAEGESIRTECSYKYTVAQAAAMANGFRLETVWTDFERRFAVLLLTVGEKGETTDV